MADLIVGPLATPPGEQGGLGGDDVNQVVPKTVNPPDPLGLNKAGGKK